MLVRLLQHHARILHDDHERRGARVGWHYRDRDRSGVDLPVVPRRDRAAEGENGAHGGPGFCLWVCVGGRGAGDV